jgi:hypothetical protein
LTTARRGRPLPLRGRRIATQQNAPLAEQSAAAAESLKEQAARLGEVVRQFTLEGAAA